VLDGGVGCQAVGWDLVFEDLQVFQGCELRCHRRDVPKGRRLSRYTSPRQVVLVGSSRYLLVVIPQPTDNNAIDQIAGESDVVWATSSSSITERSRIPSI